MAARWVGWKAGSTVENSAVRSVACWVASRVARSAGSSVETLDVPMAVTKVGHLVDWKAGSTAASKADRSADSWVACWVAPKVDSWVES